MNLRIIIMKKIILIVIIFFIYSGYIFSQIIFNPKVDSLKNLVSLQSVMRFARELSGDTAVVIGGLPYKIYSRFYLSPSKIKAAQYIFEKFQGYGLTAKYQHTDSTCLNVLGFKTGTKYPNQFFIICAHYDASLVPVPSPMDTVPGADDNASGICSVLEAARLLNNFNTQYSLIFAAFDQEEVNSGGSRGFVDTVFNRGDTIRGVLDLDMEAWDGNNDGKFVVMTDNNSNVIAEQLIGTVQAYQIPLQYNKVFSSASDQGPFLAKNYKAVLLIEDIYFEYNQNIHHLSDKVNTFNQPFFSNMVKAAVSLFAGWGSGYFARIDHKPLTSFYDTTGRIAEAYINYPSNLGAGANAPRLYYKVWNGPYNFINPYSIYQNNYKFLIPGQPRGSKISYYIAAQDSAGSYVFTLPAGGSGINPPGSIPPPQQFSYHVWTNKIVNSNTVPKPITGSLTRDTIHIQTGGTVVDVNVSLNLNHTNDGDLLISLAKTSNSTLSQYNGVGGQNFTNTVFDDSASISIIQGNPPFTGRFRPQTPLAAFKNVELSGDWVLRILDKGTGNTGTLLGWGLDIVYAPSVSVKEISSVVPEKFGLYQNYPNPFNPATKIRFNVAKVSSIIHNQTGTIVTLKIYDILGKEISVLINEQLSSGTYEVTFDGSNLPSGIYFYRFTAGDYYESRKMILIK